MKVSIISDEENVYSLNDKVWKNVFKIQVIWNLEKTLGALQTYRLQKDYDWYSTFSNANPYFLFYL